ncbi:MAG TPA: alpha/beta fold hydrolase [Accumulibacter sp.]|nr:alpha/beta fold hydrolase [Accumulibacter sp.]
MTGTAGDTRTLYLLHGWGLGRAVWQPLHDPLSRHLRVIVGDLPGYDEAPDDDTDFVATAQALVDTLPTGVTLCGWSLGAMLALQAAALAPRRVARLILFGATPCFVQRADWLPAQRPALVDDFAASVANDREHTLRRFVALLNQGDKQARPIGRSLVAGLSAAPLPAIASLLRGLDWLREIDLRPLLPTIAVPTLLIHGENDAINPLAAARHLQATIPDARLATIADAGHAPFLSDPERCVQLLIDFCAPAIAP